MSITAIICRLTNLMRNCIPSDVISIGARLFIAEIFYLSARTKVEEGSWLTVSDTAYFLFESEYALPIISPVLAAHLATYGEHLFAILILLGLATRFAALALLGMTLVIQIFVYPELYSIHLSWAVGMLYLMKYGGGVISIDRILEKRMMPEDDDEA